MMIDVSFYLLGYHTENSLAIMVFQYMDNHFKHLLYIVVCISIYRCDINSLLTKLFSFSTIELGLNNTRYLPKHQESLENRHFQTPFNLVYII